MDKTIEYIIGFLLHNNPALAPHVGYTADAAQFGNYSVVIVSSHFFDDGVYGTKQSEPELPLLTVEGIPLLFGSPKIERQGSTLVVYADIVASTYFLVSRYEEYLHPTDRRDAHGRFLGCESLLGRAGFLHRPIVDEYSDLLLKWLSEAGQKPVMPPCEYAAIYLTHDIDQLTYYRRLRGFVGGVARNLISAAGMKKVLKSLSAFENDPAYTFEWMLQQDALVKNSQSLFFIKSTIKQHKFDYPGYNLKGKDFRRLMALLRQSGCKLGLHASYASGAQLPLIISEKHQLEDALGTPVTMNRWHFLRTIQPTDYEVIANCGIEDDFTVGYADRIGFRLGTSRAVNWINPKTKETGSLRLHPLTVMDCTLSNSEYMNLFENEAETRVCEIIQHIKQHNGEVVFLWHNTVFSSLETDYHRVLYPQIIKMLNQ
ncbi:MAG: polysaccharide deacetylase family protein [Salinivirgaceae bacterium]|nr:polysaccharide deacetylase family protein [Salinivirgaceae bacterium]